MNTGFNFLPMNKKNTYWKKIGIVAIVIIFFGFGWGFFRRYSKTNTTRVLLNGTIATLYRSPNCGCCGGYIAYLKKNGIDVNVVNEDENDLAQIKKRFGIPSNLQSCHTMTLGKQTIEGHVPIEVILSLLKKPNIAHTVSLPGMPRGSVGMPGTKQGTWTIYSVKPDGSQSIFAKI